MLSPGKWHEQVPRDATANVQWRLRLYERSAGDRNFQRGIRSMCAEDIRFWINALVWQFNPDLEDHRVGPFLLWDFQERALLKEPGEPWDEDDAHPEDAGILWCVEHRQDLLIEKSREMGASWLCLLAFLWLWLFRDWNKFLSISRSEEAVESSDEDSLFWKLDFVLQHMPDWMKPKGWDEKTCRKKRYFGNPENHSSMTGQASTGKAGVGGRATAMFIDEFSQIKEDYEVLHRTSNTTRCRIFNGTHRGLDTAFHELSQRVDMLVLQMHWTQHPVKRLGLYRSCQPVEILDPTYAYPADYHFDMTGEPFGGLFPGLRSPWYDDQVKRKAGSKRAMAMDVDINPSGTVSQVFDARELSLLAAEYCKPPLWQGDLVYDAKGRHPSLVESPEGKLKLWLHPKSESLVPVGEYTIGGDSSTGNGATPSCLCVLNARTGEQVAEYANALIDQKDFGVLAVALARLFHDEAGEPAFLIWEAGGGDIMGGRIMELGFRNCYWHVNETGLALKQTDKPGWVPTQPNKVRLVEDLKKGMHMRQLLLRSEKAVKECLKFKYGNRGQIEHPGEKVNKGENDPSGAGVNHSDRAIAAGLAWKGAKGKVEVVKREEEERVPLLSLAYRRQLADNERRDEEEDW